MTGPTTLPDALAEIEELRRQVRDLLRLLGQEGKPSATGISASPAKTTEGHKFSQGLIPKQAGKDVAQYLLNLHQMTETVPGCTEQLALTHDITTCKHAEEAQADSEARFRTVVEGTSDWMWEVDAQGRYTYSSPRVRDLLGYEPEEVLGKTPFDFMLPEEAERVGLLFGSIVKAQSPFDQLENTQRHKDGHLVVLECRGVPILDAVGTLRGYRGFDRDVTKQKRAEKALRISQERYARATAVGKVGVWELDVATGLYHCDVNLKALFGYGPNELSTDPYVWLGLVHPDDQSVALRAWELVISGSTDEYHYELRMIRKNGTIIWTDVRGHAERDEQGHVQRLIGATLDITERKQAETALRISQMKLRQALEASNIGLWDWNTATNEMMFSAEWKRQLGYGVEELSDRFEEWESRLHPDDKERVLAYARAYLESPKGDYTQEFRLRHKDGAYRWIAARASFVPEPTGQRVRLLGAQMDISAQKQVEAVLALENHVLERVAEGVPLSSILDQLCQGIESIAQGCLCSILLIDKDGLHLRHGSAPSLPASYTTAIDGVAIGPSVVSCGTAAYLKTLTVVENIAADPLWADYKDVALRHGLQACWSMPIASSTAGVLGTFSVYYHIPRRPTNGEIQLLHQAARFAQIAIERKQAEQALRASEEKLRQTLLASNTGLWDWNTETNEVWLSREWKRQLGYEETELPDTFEAWESRLHPDDRDHAVTYAIQYRDHPAGAFRQDFRLRHKDGTYRWIDSQASFLTELDGRRVRLLGSHTDITDRKRAERALRESEELFAKAFRGSPNPVVISEAETSRCLEVNEAFLQLFGFSRQEVIGKTTLNLGIWTKPEKRTQLLRRLEAGEPVRNVELEFQTKTGGLRHFLISSDLIEFNGTLSLITVGSDITERKRAEETLRLTQFFVDRAVDGVLWMAPDGRILSVNEAACRMLEYSSEELTTMTVHDIDPHVPPEAWPAHWEELKQKGSMTFESKHWSSTGRVLDTEVTVHYLCYGGNEYNCAIMRDVGERKRAEADLRRSHTFLRQVIDTDPNFIFAKDRDGRFTLVNKAIAEAYGTTVENLLGKTDADFNPNRDEVASFAKKDLEVLDSLQERFIPEEKLTDASGQIRWLQTVKRPLLDDTGRVTMVLGASTDITTRKGVEQALRRRESDLHAAIAERERISQDLHDGILQSIYAIGLGLEACRPLIAEQPKKSAAKLNTELQGTIGQLNHVLEEVRNFIAGLESHILDGQEFDVVLRTMVHALAASYSVPSRVTVEKAAAQRLSTEQAYHFMNVAREALSNSFRHSHARRITLSLKCLHRAVRLSVRDNGVGFNPSSVGGTGHGLANMASRARKIGGKFTLLSKPRGGTKVVLDLPMRCTDGGN